MRSFVRRIAALASIVAVYAGSTLHADEATPHNPWSANLTLTSDYRYEGQSQTDRHGALQGGIDYSSRSGLFASVWSSTIDFNDAQQSPAEVDFVVGYSRSFADQLHSSLSFGYYWYPDSAPAHYDYYDVSLTASRDFAFVSVSGEVTYSPDYSGTSGDALNLTSGFEVPVPLVASDWLAFSAYAGRQWIKDNVAYGTPDWSYYDAGFTATWKRLAFDLRYTDTDMSEDDCFGGTKLCGGSAVLSMTLALPGS